MIRFLDVCAKFKTFDTKGSKVTLLHFSYQKILYIYIQKIQTQSLLIINQFQLKQNLLMSFISSHILHTNLND